MAIAVALAGLRTQADAAIKSIAVSAPDADTAAQQTADALADKLGATIVADDDGAVDVIVVGRSRVRPPEGSCSAAPLAHG